MNDGSGKLVRRRLLTTEHDSSSINSDKMIMRRQSSSQTTKEPLNNVPQPISTDQKFSDALQVITENPRVGTVPPLKYSVNVPEELASVLGIENEPWSMINLNLKARFPKGTSQVIFFYILRLLFLKYSKNILKN